MLSALQPSGRPHIGNYFGAMKQFIDFQNKDLDCLIMIADYHALNSTRDPKILRQNIIDLVIDYLAIGLDPKKITIFKQSDISEHTELTWIFDTITTMPFLMRAHAYKDAEAKKKELSVGIFNYPILMASDILLYEVDIVPVGQDQKQHVEYTRDIAEKFNHLYGETFKLPEAYIPKEVATVPGIDGEKMSKSYGNTIPLFSSDDEIKKLVMSIVTDSSGETPKNVYAIHKLFRDEKYLTDLYESKKGKYKDLKEALAEDITAFIKPLREKRESISSDVDLIKSVLSNGAKTAKSRASAKMTDVRQKIGVTI